MTVDEVISTKDEFTIALIGTNKEDGCTTFFADETMGNTNKNDKIIPFYNKDIPINYVMKWGNTYNE